MAFAKDSIGSLPAHWPVDSDWTEMLQNQFSSDRFRRLKEFVGNERAGHDVFPPPQDVFTAFRLCPAAAARVVILGQDPYHGPGQAHGLAFSVSGGMRLPPSLRNIFRELKADLGIDRGLNGDLTGWARQGVLLLNTVLTVRGGLAQSHQDQGWEIFSDRVIQLLANRDRPMVFLLWGRQAAEKKMLISSQHIVLESSHPSPLSAHRGFFGSRPFSATNATLKEFGQSPIDWS